MKAAFEAIALLFDHQRMFVRPGINLPATSVGTLVLFEKRNEVFLTFEVGTIRIEGIRFEACLIGGSDC